MTPRRSARNKNPSEPHKDKTDYLSTEVATKKKIGKTAKKQDPKSKAETGKTSAVEVEKTTKKKPVKNAKKQNLKSEADAGKTTIVEEEQTTTTTTKRVGRKTAKRTEDQPTVDSEDPPHKISKLITADTTEGDESSEESVDAESIYEFKANHIKGEEIPLKVYQGHVCIIVNVASRCGHTKSNYEQLVQLHDEYSESKGLRILAFPCNQFGKQEPGDAQKICEFAEKRNIKFDMFDKIDVNGKNAHPLWKFMQAKIAGPKGNKIDWNFTKFIIDKEGNVVERHKPSVKPLQMVEDLEKYW